jgi:hypothetical protein
MGDRIQQEIEELLARLETFPPRRPLWKRIRDGVLNGVAVVVGGIVHAVQSIPFPRLSAGHVVLLAIIAIVFLYLAGGGGDIVRWLIIAAIFVFIAAFIMSLRRHSPNRPTEKLWRGKPMDLHSGRHSRPWWERWRTRR